MANKAELYKGVNEGLRAKYLLTLNEKQKDIEKMPLDRKAKLLDKLERAGIITTLGYLDYFQTLHRLEDFYKIIPDEFIKVKEILYE